MHWKVSICFKDSALAFCTLVISYCIITDANFVKQMCFPPAAHNIKPLP